MTIEQLYNNPHLLDSFLQSGEPIAVLKGGTVVAEIVPKTSNPGDPSKESLAGSRPDFRGRFIAMWGQQAFAEKESVSDLFAELRRERDL